MNAFMYMSPIFFPFNDTAVLDNQTDIVVVFQGADILQRILFADDQIGQFAGFDGAQAILPAETFGGRFGGGAEPLPWATCRSRLINPARADWCRGA